MGKIELLRELKDKMDKDVSLPLRGPNLVFGEGNPDAAVMFIGEGPGFHEDRLRRPFVGRAGQLLDELIKEIGWKRGDVYISNIIKHRPPENRDPLPEELAAYSPYLAREIEIVNPKIISALGRFAMNFFLPEAKISRDHGRLFRVGDRLIYPVYHPAAALRSTEMLKVLRQDFIRLPDVVSGKYAGEAAAVKTQKPAKKEAPRQTSLF